MQLESARCRARMTSCCDGEDVDPCRCDGTDRRDCPETNNIRDDDDDDDGDDDDRIDDITQLAHNTANRSARA